ncbi:neutrophil defensin 1-like [Sapajus apella]|uniref:Neutrophil defensin 1-like n=1 Tax=Sapajus apella TaxID=9515 RepID=A0A6J3HC70_SAPAP|nr:neutrophil defensin 1-like [Sapajus apella]
MRTLIILAAILLVALQAQAGLLQARADEAAAAEKISADNNDVAISFAWDESLIPRNSGSRENMACFCRIPSCIAGERHLGTCLYQGRLWAFCC